MTTPRKRLAQLAEGALPHLVYPILTQNPVTGEEEKSFDALAHAADLKALLSEREVGREALAGLIARLRGGTIWTVRGRNEGPDEIDEIATDALMDEAADAILSLLGGDTID